jgi:hypothetical protein
MSRPLRAALCAMFLLAFIAEPAVAHETPKYQSVYGGIQPSTSGLEAQVLGFDNQYELIDRVGKTVVVYGYQGEPYGRVLPDGTVQVNVRSPAYYLNQDRFGTTSVPASANAKAPPLWKDQDKTGRFIWHDHRMHWMSQALPSQVKDQHKKTKIFNYSIPLSVNGKQAKLTGTLFWRGTPGGFPVGAIVALIAVVLGAVAFVIVVRRRRRSTPAAKPSSGLGPRRDTHDAEAW